MDKLSTQKRVLIATLLSFLFFVVYDYFFVPKRISVEQNITANSANAASKNSAAPVNSSVSGPANIASGSQNTSKILTKIKAKNYEAHID